MTYENRLKAYKFYTEKGLSEKAKELESKFPDEFPMEKKDGKKSKD